MSNTNKQLQINHNNSKNYKNKAEKNNLPQVSLEVQKQLLFVSRANIRRIFELSFQHKILIFTCNFDIFRYPPFTLCTTKVLLLS